MAIFKFYFDASVKDSKLSSANTEILRLARARDTEIDGGIAVSEDDNGTFLQAEGSPTLLRCIAMVINATIQEKSDLETMLNSL